MKPLQPSSPHIIALVGTPGAGKSHFAEEFAKMFHAPLFSADKLEMLSSDSKAINEVALDLLKQFAKTQQTIIFDGATEQRIVRTKIAQIARENGYKLLLVWVQTDPATAKSRWMKAHSNETLFEQKLKHFSPPHNSEHCVVISGQHTFNTQARTVLKRLSGNRTPSNIPERRSISNRLNIG